MSSEAGKTSSVTWRDVPTSVWALGFVSLLMDVSSELIHSLLPVFLVTVVGASTTIVGLIEGVAEATAAIAKVFSGALSDRIGKRKLLVGIGYALGRRHQAGVSAGEHGLGGSGRAFRRPYRQGHPRCAARCADRRHYAAGDPRRRLRHPSGAGYGRSVCRAAAGDGADGALCQRLPRRVLVGGGSGCACGAADRCRRPGAGWHQGNGEARLADPQGGPEASVSVVLDGRCNRRQCSPWRASARPFWC